MNHFDEIIEKAEALNIDTNHMKELDLVRAIQRAQDKISCYGTEWVDYCEKETCVWRKNCSELIHQRFGHIQDLERN